MTSIVLVCTALGGAGGGASAEESDPCALRTPLGPLALSEGASDPSLYLSPQGALRAIMIFVDFPDAPGDRVPAEAASEMSPIVEEWMEDASGGKATLDIDVIPGWKRMPRPSADYGIARDGISFFALRDLMVDGIAAVDPTTDLRAYKLVFLITPKESGVEYSPAFVAPPEWGIHADGNDLRFGTVLGNEQLRGSAGYAARTLVHEMGHSFGLPDLYLFSAPGTTGIHGMVGGWDPMGMPSVGARPLAWHRYKLGWIERSQIRCIEDPTSRVDVTLTPASEPGGMQAAVVVDGDSFYTIEYRDQRGIDAATCDSGALIAKVEPGTVSGSGPVEIMGADTGNGCGPKGDAALGEGGSLSIETDSGLLLEVTVTKMDAASLGIRIFHGEAADGCDGTHPTDDAARQPARPGGGGSGGSSCVADKRPGRRWPTLTGSARARLRAR